MGRYLAAIISLFVIFFIGQEGVQGKDAVTEGFSIPVRELSYTAENIPQWKKTWDHARHFSRQSQFIKARETYVSLLDLRPGLDTARWEYTSVLLYLHQWQDAGEQLDQLLQREPGKHNYLLARAKVAQKTGQSQQALILYGQLYQAAPGSASAEEALNGLIASLETLGRTEGLLPLMEQLQLRQEQNPLLLKRMGMLAIQQQELHRGAKLLTRFLEEWPEDKEAIQALADAYKAWGQADQEAVLLEKIVAIDPKQVEVRKSLVRYYLAQRQKKSALKHLEALISLAPYETSIFLQAADLHMEGGRIDRALDYYAHYLEQVPEDSYALKQRNTALHSLATDLVVLVENSGSEVLWHDLVEVTSYRSGVYLAMANILRQQHKYKELADVLLVVSKELPDNLAINEELTSLLKSQGRYQELHKM